MRNSGTSFFSNTREREQQEWNETKDTDKEGTNRREYIGKSTVGKKKQVPTANYSSGLLSTRARYSAKQWMYYLSDLTHT